LNQIPAVLAASG